MIRLKPVILFLHESDENNRELINLNHSQFIPPFIVSHQNDSKCGLSRNHLSIVILEIMFILLLYSELYQFSRVYEHLILLLQLIIIFSITLPVMNKSRSDSFLFCSEVILHSIYSLNKLLRGIIEQYRICCSSFIKLTTQISNSTVPEFKCFSTDISEEHLIEDESSMKLI